MKKIRALLLGICSMILIIAGAFTAMAKTEENTVKLIVDEKIYTFYVSKCEETGKNKFYVGGYTLDEEGNKDLRIALMKEKNKWSMIFDDGTMARVATSSILNESIDWDVEDKKMYTGTFGEFRFMGSERRGQDDVWVEGGEFNFTLGQIHNKMKELEENKTEATKKKTMTTSGTKKTQTHYHDEYCNHCNGLGDCDMCFGSGREQCMSCFGSGMCQRCYGLGGQYQYTYGGNRWVRCSSCSGVGNCRTCYGVGDKACGYCSGLGYCRYCGGDGMK